MASPQYRTRDLYRAASDRQWDEVRRIIRAAPELVNEKWAGYLSLLYQIVYPSVPRDVVSESLKSATAEAVNWVDPRWDGGDCILHRIADLGYVQEMRQALRISATNVNVQDRAGYTPIHRLLQANHSYRDHIDAASHLLKVGADANLKNSRGQTPAEVYRENKCGKYDPTNKHKQKEMLIRFLQTGILPTEILARGPEALEAYSNALDEGETEVNQGRTVFMGLERVGKTSTIKSFLRNTFDPNEGITDAIANTTVCTHESHDELNWKETSPDHSGANGMYEAKMADSIAKKILEKESKKNVEVTRQSVLSPAKAETKYSKGQSSWNVNATNPKMESDTKEQTQTQSMEDVPETIATKVQEQIQVLNFTGGNVTQEQQKSGNNFIMSIWDFGGQPIYHVIQRIFMVSFAIVCVVFNLEDDLDSPAKVRDPTTGDISEHRMTNLEFILYWIRSVYTNSKDSELEDGQLSPPVLVIGTHLGSLEGNEEEKNSKVEEIFDKIRKALEGKPYENMVSTFFAIENSLPFAKSNASNIMNQILKFAKQMIRKLPLKWLLVQQEIQKLKVKNIYLPTNEVIALVERCGVKQDAQRVLLEYLHDLGEILYFPDDEELKDIIVLDLMNIVDMFKTVITVINPNLRKPKHRKAWRRLDSGVLEEHLLRHLWKKFNFSDKTFNFFVSLMQKFGLVCEKTSTMGGKRIFYVLSRLKPERIDATQTKDYGMRAVSIFHDFGRYLPDDLFQRGVTKFIERFQVKDSEPTLFYEHVELNIEELHHVVLSVASVKHRRMFKTTIIRRKIISAAQLTQEEEPSPIVCKKVLRFLERELKMFCQSGARGVELTRYIACECRGAHMHIVRKFDMDVLPCGSNGMEVTRYRRLFEDDVQQQQVQSGWGSFVAGIGTWAINMLYRLFAHEQGFADDAIIVTISEDLNLSWRRFGVRLGLKWSKVNVFNAKGSQTQKAAENMMNYWKSSLRTVTHQRKVLCTALKQHKLRKLAEDLFEGEFGDENVDTQEAGKCFNDQDLLFICDNLDPELWRRLGVRLELKWTNIKKIAKNNRLVEDCMMQLLVTWRDDQAKSQQVPTMVNALRQQQLAGLAESVCERHGYSDEAEAAPTRITLPQIPTPVQGNCFDDQDLLFICDNLESGSWRRLGVRLGLKWSSINKIANYEHVEDRIMELLITWRDDQSKIHQVPTMVKALRQQQLVGLAQRVCEKHGYSDESEVEPTQMNLPHIPSPEHGYLDDIDMVFISDKLDGKDFTNFGIYLDMKKHEIDRIKSDLSPPIVDACIEMLVQWRERQKAEENHLETISEALNKLKRIDIKEELETYYQKKYGKIEAKDLRNILKITVQ